jgi:outer membrane lipoprotein-sorting protein
MTRQLAGLLSLVLLTACTAQAPTVTAPATATMQADRHVQAVSTSRKAIAKKTEKNQLISIGIKVVIKQSENKVVIGRKSTRRKR